MPRVNTAIEDAFRKWFERGQWCHTGGELTAGELERLVLGEVFQSGEVFVRQHFRSFGGSPIRQEIGLGSATTIRRVEVRWPASGSRSVVRRVPLDSMIRITEGQDSFEKLDVKRVPLPGGKTPP